MASLTLQTTSTASVEADVLVLGIAATETGPRLVNGEALTDAARGYVEGCLESLGVTGTAQELHRIPAPPGSSVPSLALVGLGPVSSHSRQSSREAAGAASRQLAGADRVAFALPTDSLDDAVAIAEGALLGSYAFDRYRVRTASAVRRPVTSVVVLTQYAQDKAADREARRVAVVADAVHAVRDLVNTPPSALSPADFAAHAIAVTKDLPITVTVLDEQQLAEGGYGGLVAVGMGSARPPRLVQVDYVPAAPAGHLALVGKGITFDSGGLSLKTAAGMETMKLDMSGAAAVLHAVVAAAQLELPVHLTGWLALAENLPSGTAQRPSDVLTIRGGQTVEVLNTDAEGRLVLADALVAAGEQQPDAIVDVATLTGTQVQALGTRIGGLMSNDDTLRAQLARIAEDADEPVWPMPLPRYLRPSLDSKVADLANVGAKHSGMLLAGLFLQEFILTRSDADQRPIPWAHLDVCGPAFNSDAAHGYTPVGGTGTAVRTLVALAAEFGR